MALGVLAATVYAVRAEAPAPGAGTWPLAWSRLLAEARERVQAYYVDPVDDAHLAEAAVRGMAEALDAHSEYLDPAQYAAVQREVAGADGVPVQSRRLGGVGYLRIAGFSHATPGQVAMALRELAATRLTGLVIDLRGNPGGVLEAATTVADDFLDAGLIVRGEGRGPGADFRIEATQGQLLPGVPLAVLVDGGTASAAEVLAAALKDHGRARIVGRRTWGKGTVQTLLPLERGALRLTTARYFTPAGDSIEEKGIMPDVPGTPGSKLAPGLPGTPDPDLDLALSVLADAPAVTASRHARP